MTGTMVTNPQGPSARSPEPSPHERPAKEVAASAPQAMTSLHSDSLVQRLFFGTEGLYPAYRWLIYLAMGVALFIMLLLVTQALHTRPGATLWWTMAAEACMMLAAIVPAFVMARLEQVPFAAFGLPASEGLGRNFWVGAVWGMGSLTILMLALRVAGAFDFGAPAEHGMRIAKFAIYYAVFFLMTGLFEEFLWRGYSQWVVMKTMRFWPAAVFLSATFAAVHATNYGETRVGLLTVFCMGMFFAFTLQRTGNLWWAVGFHASWDFSESFLYSAPDSGTVAPGHLLNSSFHGPAWLTGGTVGPEGSYLVFVLLVVLWFAFDRMYPGVKYGEVKSQKPN